MLLKMGLKFFMQERKKMKTVTTIDEYIITVLEYINSN